MLCLSSESICQSDYILVTLSIISTYISKSKIILLYVTKAQPAIDEFRFNFVSNSDWNKNILSLVLRELRAAGIALGASEYKVYYRHCYKSGKSW